VNPGFPRSRLAQALGLVAWLFFAWQLGGWAFAEVLLLWALIVATIVAFWRFSRPAAMLNFRLWRANPGLLG